MVRQHGRHAEKPHEVTALNMVTLCKPWQAARALGG